MTPYTELYSIGVNNVKLWLLGSIFNQHHFFLSKRSVFSYLDKVQSQYIHLSYFPLTFEISAQDTYESLFLHRIE